MVMPRFGNFQQTVTMNNKDFDWSEFKPFEHKQLFQQRHLIENDDLYNEHCVFLGLRYFGYEPNDLVDNEHVIKQFEHCVGNNNIGLLFYFNGESNKMRKDFFNTVCLHGYGFYINKEVREFLKEKGYE